MKINNPKIYNHLIKRGYITRIGYGGKIAVYFGMDNCPWEVHFHLGDHAIYWCPSLACYKADDWEIVDAFWPDTELAEVKLKTKRVFERA